MVEEGAINEAYFDEPLDGEQDGKEMNIQLGKETFCLVQEASDDGLADQASDLNSDVISMTARPLEAT